VPGMPYHLEKGPWLSVLEDYLNGTPDGAIDALARLRRPELSLTDTGFLATPALDKDPEYETLAKRQAHLRNDWFGADGGDTDGGTHSFSQAVLDRLGDDDRERFAPSAPDIHAGAVHLHTWTCEVAEAAPAGLGAWPTTGFWAQYFGNVEAILRETLVRAIEVSLGLDHGEAVPAGGPTRRLPIELFWKCPQRWFEGWVTWRWDQHHGTGQVTVILATPGSGKPLLENPDLGMGAVRADSSRAIAPDTVGTGPGPCNPAANPDQGAHGMWVVTHHEHLQLPALHPDAGLPEGQWLVPAFGPTYLGVGPVVCVQPSEADGGVNPFGRPYQPTPATEAAS